MTCPNGAGDWKDKTMNLEGKRVLVVGSGKSGVAAAELLRKKESHLCFLMEIKI